ncbi:MAG: hypothetical protein SWX82_32460 [Cyanobacteriota bacterium]|nr:hypothetical protein [Cyanobacteriota bacterium]
MFRKFKIIGGTILVYLSIAGCGPSKIVQCNQLIVTINKGNTLVNSENSFDAATTNQLGGDLEAISQELEALKLEDETLQQFQTDLTQTFQELSQAFLEMSLALKTSTQVEASLEGRKKFNQAKNQLTKTGQQINKIATEKDILLDKLVTYCQDQ